MVDGPQSWNVVLDPSSTADSGYNGLDNVNVELSTTDDDNPTVLIDAPRVTEGDSGSTSLTFTVRLSPANFRQASVAYAQTGGTATSGTDYTAVTAGTLMFAAGETSKTFTVSVTGDTNLEVAETVIVTLSSPSNAVFSGGATTITGTGTIVNDDGPTFSIDSPSVSEGNRGETTMTFTVTLNPAATGQVTVDFEDTGTGTATWDTDYVSRFVDNTLIFMAGETSKTIDVEVRGDTVSESSETVVISLGSPNPSHTPILTPTGTGTIVDDDRVLSSDSSLSSLVLSAGQLSPSFSSSTLSYTATVDRSVEQLTVTPTASTAVSGIRVNSQRVSSGSASRSIDLSFGENPISVLVLAENLSYRVYQIVVTREETDRIPDEFSYTAKNDAEPGSTVTSEAIVVAGLGEGESAEISVSGGTLIVDGNAFSGATVTNGQQVAVSVVASDASGGTATATVTIGGVRANFTVTTRDALSADQTPDAFSFAVKDGVEPGSRVTSDAVTVSGLGDSVATAISVSGGTLEVDGQGFTGTTVTNGQQVAVSVVASSEFGGTATATVTIGGVRGVFTATTRVASSNADLRSLTFSPAISLSPSFASGTDSYTARVSGQISTLTVLATPAHSGASVNISPADASTSTTGHQMNLNAGPNTATIVVTAEDNRTRKTYTAAVTRVEATAMEAIGELDREIVTEVSREVASSTLQAIAGRISNAVGNVPTTVAVPTAGLLPILEIFDRHDRDSSGTRSTLHQSLDGANFVMSLTEGNAGEESGMSPSGAAIWGSADYRSMSGGRNSTVSWDGELFSVHAGTDALLDSGMLVGLAAGLSRGTFDYSGGSRNTRGQLKTRMTSLHPYLGWTASERLNLWMTVGYGQGKIEYNDSGLSPSASDTSLTTTAFGSRYRLNDGDFRMLGESVMVDLKSEAWGTRLTVKGNNARQEKTSIRTHGVRLAVEGSQERKMETGATVTPFGELGVRWDGGEGDTGTGLELGGGLKLLAPCQCQTVNASARYLATHESGRKEWGVGMSIRRDLNYDRTGMSYGASLSHGETGSEVETLWESSAAGRADEADRLATRAEAEVGYGLYGADGIYTPYAGLGLVDNSSRDYAVGIRYTGEAALSLGLEFNRLEKTDKSPDHRIMLTGQVDW